MKSLIGDGATVQAYTRVYETVGSPAEDFEQKFLSAVDVLVARPYTGWISSEENLWTKESIVGAFRCLLLLSEKEYRGRKMLEVSLGFSDPYGMQLQWEYAYSDNSFSSLTLRIQMASTVEIDGQMIPTTDRCYLIIHDQSGFAWGPKELPETVELTR